MLGTFHEISITTRDISASVQFYEALGFHHCVTGDIWPHPYGVMTDGRVFLGLHEYRFPSPSITCVRADIARYVPDYEKLGIELAFAKTGSDSFNEIGFRDPGGQMITILEARTYSPPGAVESGSMESQCGWFAEFSLPATDFGPVAEFWERFGFLTHEPLETPYVSQALSSDRLNLALHRPRTCEVPMLVFRDPAMRERVAALRAAGVDFDPELPRSLDPGCNAMLRAPEETPLLLLQEP
jgi:catechol 2,3-dioxygenase-like lactoylglutathione lyase family enzyme